MKIAAIPTKYSGIQFRSRLEARWFAFFDLLKWSPQYEPFDLDGWIPDFQVTVGPCDMLVEVKPIKHPISSAKLRAILLQNAGRYYMEAQEPERCAELDEPLTKIDRSIWLRLNGRRCSSAYARGRTTLGGLGGSLGP